MTRSPLFDTDGSIIPNIRTQRYALQYTPTLKNTKIQGAIIVIDAPDLDGAWRYGLQAIRLPQMTLTAVEVLPKDQTWPTETQPHQIPAERAALER